MLFRRKGYSTIMYKREGPARETTARPPFLAQEYMQRQLVLVSMCMNVGERQLEDVGSSRAPTPRSALKSS